MYNRIRSRPVFEKMKGDAKKKYRKDFYTAQFIPNINKVRNGHRREHCSANRNQINKIGISQGQQVRIVRPWQKEVVHSQFIQ